MRPSDPKIRDWSLFNFTVRVLLIDVCCTYLFIANEVFAGSRLKSHINPLSSSFTLATVVVVVELVEAILKRNYRRVRLERTLMAHRDTINSYASVDNTYKILKQTKKKKCTNDSNTYVPTRLYCGAQALREKQPNNVLAE